MNTRWLLWPALTGLVLTFASAVDAGSCTYSVGLDSITQPDYLPDFDPAMGRLVSIGIVAHVTVSGEFFLQDPVSSVDVYAGADFVRVTGDNPRFGSVGGFATESFSPAADVIDVSVVMDASYVLTGDALDSFYGTDMVNVQVIPAIETDAGGFDPYPAQAAGTLIITYNFVPEPSSLVIAATGAITLLGYACRRGFRQGLLVASAG